MKTTIELHLRAFPVSVRDQRSGKIIAERVVLDKQQLQAAQMVGQSSKELIERIYSRRGFKVLDIGKPDKRTVQADLSRLYNTAGITLEEVMVE